MPPTEDRPHITVPVDRFRRSESYTPHVRPRRQKPGPPPGGRHAHGEALFRAIEAAVSASTVRREAARVSVATATPGLYLEFESFPELQLAIESLEKRRGKDPARRIEVVAVTERTKRADDTEKRVEVATVFVPDTEVRHFLKQIEKYARKEPRAKGERRHENTYDRIAHIRLATLRALWTDDEAGYPATENEPIWWEVWLRSTDGRELDRFREFADQVGIRLYERFFRFDDRIVILAYASPGLLSASLDVLGDIAELRRAKETPAFFVAQDATEQEEWVADLVKRTKESDDDAPSVCILDTGVTRGHPLLAHSLSGKDCHTCDPAWGVHDHHGHGSEMAGLALYGDLVPILSSSAPVALTHRLESVKILPPNGKNPPELYGAITAEAVSRPEVAVPTRLRVFSMAVTAPDSRDRGQPTSWSSAIDALAAGRSLDPAERGLVYLDDGEEPKRRLFVISAGNVCANRLEKEYLARCDVEPVHDPAQAWNALTVGAYTEKGVIQDRSWRDWTPLANPGDLSPWSTTSLTFQARWPIKPDVVLEGGNVAYDGAGNIDFPCDDLSVLTTFYRPSEKLLVTTWATSAAAAQGARMCAIIWAQYPFLWPETVRALVVHSAEWTPAMKAHLANATSKAERLRLVRRYGFGVPRLQRALRSANHAVTLLVQDSIHPFDGGRMREIHFHELPWPADVLAALGDKTVRVRITLSYFVEPNPARRGWRNRFRYQSHGLRFEIKSPTESLDEFRKRLNREALDEEEGRPGHMADSGQWFLGPRARNRGSLHSDILVGFGADIAQRGVIAVYPVSGWWKDMKHRDRSKQGGRYSLVVSIETEDVEADVWTPVAQQVGVPVAVDL